MQAYQEITLIPDADITPYFIWSKLYMQLHLALVEVQNADGRVNIGISFPKYRYVNDGDRSIATLGNQLRVFAPDEQQLKALNLEKWLTRLTDYVHLRRIQPLSADKITAHLHVQRMQYDRNQHRLTRRYASRHHLSHDEAKNERNRNYAVTQGVSIHEAEKIYHSPKSIQHPLPYLNMHSLSGMQYYHLSIKQYRAEKACSGTFNTYGLSSRTTVPHW